MLDAIYYNVRTGKPCRITLGNSTDPNVIPVKSYRQILNGYALNPEQKFLAPGGKMRCDQWTRGILERDYVIANQHIPCGKETRRNLTEGPVDHQNNFSCRVYKGKAAADAGMIRWLSHFSERTIQKVTGLKRDTIRRIRHGELVRASTFQKIADFRREKT